MPSTASSPPSSTEIRRFNARINKLVAEAAAAEDDTIAVVRSELVTAQNDFRLIVASSDAPAAQIARMQKRLTTLDEVLNKITATSIADAAQAGAGMIDESLHVAGLTTSAETADVAGLVADKTKFTQGLITARVEDLELRAAHQISRLGAGTDLQAVLSSIGEDLTGSPVFGRITADSDAMLRTALGDTHGAGAINRSQHLEATDGHQLRKRWIHTPSDDPRPAHVRAAAATILGIPLDQPFDIGRYHPQRPRGPGLPGVERAGCKCRLDIVLKNTAD